MGGITGAYTKQPGGGFIEMKLTVGYTQMSKNSYGKCNSIEKKRRGGGGKEMPILACIDVHCICFRLQVNCVNFNR